MYKLEDITSVHLEITSKCQARCPMCPRRLHGGPLLEGMYLKEIDLKTFTDWFPRNFVSQLKHVYMCGNLGDPMIANDTTEIFRYMRQINPDMSLQMHTNGSGRNREWWEDLAKMNVKVVFGIDGLSDTHSLYRINTDWNKVISNAKAFIDAGGHARWDMLVFAHNEHQVEDCERMSKDLGFQGFSVKHTTRFRDGKFDVIDDGYNLMHTLFPSQKSLEMIDSVKKAQREIMPAITCKAKTDSAIYVAANGNVSPCCWLDMEWMPKQAERRLDYMIKIKQVPNLNQNTLAEIFDSRYFDKIQNSWSTCGLKECSKQCGSFDKLNRQFA
jgi:MoaA/NifB/PqqE/SkfB family radical SAM enzyme